MKKRRTNSVLWLRIRTQKSGKKYYYLEIPDAFPRQEVALGSDLESALMRRREMLFRIRCLSRVETNEVVFTLQMYEEIAVPLLAPPARKENSASIGKLIDFFRNSELSWNDVESSEFQARYTASRGPQRALRIQGELALLKKTRVAFNEWSSDSMLTVATENRTTGAILTANVLFQ